ncbi:LuxR family transcriptional regulator (plasmid) [Devosia neptuniae]|uniref:LuxR family transcriptional regulator n=1 Tax=Devosia neptuniae TaxID=191302 RepID=A0ABY6C7G2_9HYPH|nr:LuxR family transcriptional regulator [Devosia neptuniae]UXN68180.1 LuxR family transcriptional regulator [Devosia neptuniae]
MLERIVRSSTVAEALRTMRDHYGLSHVTYHLAQTVVGKVDSPFVRTTYPDSWVARYLLKGYIHVDPITREGFARSLPFDWDEVETTSSDEPFLIDAAKHGVGSRGCSIPITDKAGRRALVSVNSMLPEVGWRNLMARFLNEWVELGQLIHRIAIAELYGERDPVPALTRREIECLHWTALGKDHRDIAVILSISEHTARDYTKSARLKLGCATLSAAVTRANHLRIISPWPSGPP